MKNKKMLILIIFIIVVVAIIFGVFMATHNPNYIYNLDGTITDEKAELIEHLKLIEDDEQRKEMVDVSLERNWITQEEANEIY